jgi:hypothetical protein
LPKLTWATYKHQQQVADNLAATRYQHSQSPVFTKRRLTPYASPTPGTPQKRHCHGTLNVMIDSQGEGTAKKPTTYGYRAYIYWPPS